MTLIGLAAIAGWGFVVVLLMFWRSFIPAYLNKKGENLATHEDINKLVDQVRVVTTTAKEIEAKISNDALDRQKQWELKRDAILNVAKTISQIEEALVGIESTLQVEQRPTDLEFKNEILLRLQAWHKAAAEFDEARLLLWAVSARETIEAVNAFGLFTFNLAAQMSSKRDATIYRKSGRELAKAVFAVRAAIRKELGFADLPILRTTESLAAESPGPGASE
jgi:hypothetical protein